MGAIRLEKTGTKFTKPKGSVKERCKGMLKSVYPNMLSVGRAERKRRMEQLVVKFYGGLCISLTYKKAKAIVNDFLNMEETNAQS